MAITVDEKFGRRLGVDSAEITYLVRGTDDAGAARAALLSSSPVLDNLLVRNDAQVEEVDGLEDTWLGVVRYGLIQPTGGSTFSFDTSGGTQRITQSIQTIQKYAPAGKTAPDFKGAIGVTADSVEGVDITVPIYSFSETHYLDAAVVTDAYKGAVFSLTGKVNIAAFRGLQAGECLFLGASGSMRLNEGDWEITFRFAGSPNRTGLTVGDIAGIAKKGWEYLWARHAETEDTAAKAIVRRPIAVYIEKVYEDGDFSALGI